MDRRLPGERGSKDEMEQLANVSWELLYYRGFNDTFSYVIR